MKIVSSKDVCNHLADSKHRDYSVYWADIEVKSRPKRALTDLFGKTQNIMSVRIGWNQ